MIVLIVEEETGKIHRWMDAPAEWVAVQPVPSGHVMVKADRFPNYPNEGFVKALARRPDLDLPDVPHEMHGAEIDQRRAPVREKPDG